MRANPEEFRDVARRLRTEMLDAEVDARKLRSASVYFELWRSPAATEFSLGHHASLLMSDYPVRDLRRLADALEHAAGDLEDAIGTVRSIEGRVRSWFASQPLPEDGSSPRWEQQWWRYRPGRFPASEDSEWLEVNRYLRSLGVYV